MHGLAQYARGLSNFSAWIDEALFIIEHFVTQDVLFYPHLNKIKSE